MSVPNDARVIMTPEKWSEVQSQISALQSEVTRLEVERNALVSEADERLDVISQYREQRDRLFNCLKQILPGDYSMDSADVQTARMFRTLLDKDRERLKKERDDATAAATRWREGANGLVKELETARAELHQKWHQCKTLKEERNALVRQVSTLDNAVRALNDLCRKRGVEIETLREERDEAKKETSRLLEINQSLQSRLDVSDEALSKSFADHARTQMDFARITKELETENRRLCEMLDSLSDEEIQCQLDRASIDMKPALERLRLMIDAKRKEASGERDDRG